MIGILCTGFILLFDLPPAKAAGAPGQWTNCNGSGTGTETCTFTSNVQIGSVIVVDWLELGGTGCPCHITSITDTLGNTISKVQGVEGTSTTQVDTEIWSSPTTTSGGADTITVHDSGTPNFQRWRVDEVANSAGVIASSNGAGTTVGTGTQTLTVTSFTPGMSNFVDSFLASNGITASACAAPTNMGVIPFPPGTTILSSEAGFWQGNYPSTLATTLSTACTGTNFNGYSWVYVAASFSSSPPSTTTTTATTTVTTQATVTNALLQVGGIPSNSSSFALFSKTPEMIYVQNPVASAASLVNITLKLAATDITSSTAILYLGLYQQNNPNQVPSASNPMQLINPTISYNIANGTTGFIHVPIAEIQVNGPITICGYCYWGIGIWTNGNHSSGASNSGVYLYQASVANTVGGSAPTDALCGAGLGHPGYPWQYLPNQATSAALPSNWYFIACSLQKNLAYVAFISYGVAIVYAGSITQTVTSATTITLSTGTTTVTTTANAASQTVIQGANFYLAMTLIVGIFMVGLWAGGIGGGMLGAIIGEVASIAAGVFTPAQATLILVSTLIGCAAAFGLGQGARGRGFGL